MVVGEASINNIMGGIESTGGVRLHNHRRKLKQRFDIIKKLGQGTYGKVQLGINKETGQEVAIKTIKKCKIETEADLIRIRREIQIMSSVQHPNIIHIYEVFENREKMVLVMEYAAGGELYDYLSERKVLSEDEARRIFRQIATAVYYCHKHKICHRDLKLENILLDENGSAKIADFGLSNVFDGQRLLSTFCGSPLYASPEIVRGTPYLGPEVDCWSLGVLLYTLVYGAMPFDGSNFKRLVKQISQGDYFEPKKPSPASPLIKDMLTVAPHKRASIDKICSHWWVNADYDESCLDIAEELANQTPVRLDLLLSLAPPPPQVGSDKMVITGEAAEDTGAAMESIAPVRSQSTGSLMDMSHPAERRIRDLVADEKSSPKRKLEATVSTENANQSGAKRKDRSRKKERDTSSERKSHRSSSRSKKDKEKEVVKDATMTEVNNKSAPPIIRNLTQPISKENSIVEEMKQKEAENKDAALEGAVCKELIEEAKQKEKPKEDSNKKETVADKENKVDEKPEKKDESKIPAKRKTVKKKVLTDKNQNETPVEKPKESPKEPEKKEKQEERVEQENKPQENTEVNDKEEEPKKPVERRRSKIFETAEKFQNMLTGTESKSSVTEKPKKIVIPGVNVGGFKKEFERKASLTSTQLPTVKNPAPNKKIIDVEKQQSFEENGEKQTPSKAEKTDEKVENETEKVEETEVVDDERKKKLKNAVSIISSALDKEGTRKSKSRPCVGRKPPIPFGTGGRSASGSITTVTSPLSPTEGKRFLKLQVGPETKVATIQVSNPEHTKYQIETKTLPKPAADSAEIKEDTKKSSAEITLKSATLPRRKTTKAEITLNYPQPKPATMEFKTEMAHHIEGQPKLSTQKSEVAFPVSAAPNISNRSASAEPESKSKGSSKERIIPISFEKQKEEKSPTPKPLQTQTSNQSQTSNSLSRQSTQESDSEPNTPSSAEPIRKSPREYIIPIAVEGGGYVTPRAGSLEPSETGSTTSGMTSSSKRSKFGRTTRMGSLFSDREGSEDESPFSTLHRYSSMGKDSDNEDSKRDTFSMHRLRSSRPFRKANLEHADSLSSAEEDDDDGFEILTAENLFSTLLSRVRNLTQRLNVEDGGRPGFPSSRLLSHFDHGTNFWNFPNRTDPLSRHSPLGRAFSREQSTGNSATANSSFNTPWRRSVSRDLASDIESVFNEGCNSASSLPRDNSKNSSDLNLSDLDLGKLKLSKEDVLALSYLTPGLSRRIQKQLLAQLPASQARKLSRTMSVRSSKPEENKSQERRSTEPTIPNMDLPKTRMADIEDDRFSELLRPPMFRRSVSRERYSPLELYGDNRSFSDDAQDLNSRTDLSESDRILLENYRKTRPRRALRSMSLLDSHKDAYKSTSTLPKSPDSSLSDSFGSRNDLSSVYVPEKSILGKYLSPSATRFGYDPNRFSSLPETESKSRLDLRNPRRTSRFLRPDFYTAPREENVYAREKKEREMETQKVLKEIRDKRIKNRLNQRKEKEKSNESNDTKKTVDSNKKTNEETPKLNSDEGKAPTGPAKQAPTPEEKPTNQTLTPEEKPTNQTPTPEEKPTNQVPTPEEKPTNPEPSKISRISKLVRPKSYPSDKDKVSPEKVEASPEKDVKSKIGKLKKLTPKKEKTPDDKQGKNKFLSSIEKKFEKLRFNNDSENKEEKKSRIENAIKRLREQSLPRTMDHITESGLIKRAVSVEDIPMGNVADNKLQTSRKSVSKILNLFKKYEEKEKDKAVNVRKPKEKKNEVDKPKLNGAETVMKVKKSEPSKSESPEKTDAAETKKPADRPKSLLFERVQRYQNMYNGARSDTVLDKIDEKQKPVSRLPVNSFRRSLNLENPPKTETQPADRKNSLLDPPKIEVSEDNTADVPKNDRKNLHLDLKKIGEANPNGRNCLHIETNPSLLSPEENDASCDSWSVCSNDLSPVSPNAFSGDENESVSDRIRRKSFYSRFNEKKKVRKSPLVGGSHGYKNLEYKYRDILDPDAYKTSQRKYGGYKSPDEEQKPKYGYGLHSLNYPERDTKNYGLINDGLYNHLSNKYQTYNPKLHRRSLYSPTSSDIEGFMDDRVYAGKPRKYSFQTQSSRASDRSSLSPSVETHSKLDSTSSAHPYVNSPKTGFAAASTTSVNNP